LVIFASKAKNLFMLNLRLAFMGNSGFYLRRGVPVPKRWSIKLDFVIYPSGRLPGAPFR